MLLRTPWVNLKLNLTKVKSEIFGIISRTPFPLRSPGRHCRDRRSGQRSFLFWISQPDAMSFASKWRRAFCSGVSATRSVSSEHDMAITLLPERSQPSLVILSERSLIGPGTRRLFAPKNTFFLLRKHADLGGSGF